MIANPLFRDRETFIPNEEVEELSLFLPSWQIMALAKVAEQEGLTVGQFLRHHLVKKTPVPTSFS